MTNYPLHVNDDGLAPGMPGPAVPPTTEQPAAFPLPVPQSPPESLEARLFREGYLTADQLSELVRVHVQTQRPMESLVAELGVVPLSALEGPGGGHPTAEVTALPTWDLADAAAPEVVHMDPLTDDEPLPVAEEHPPVEVVVDSNPNPEVDLEGHEPAVVAVEHVVVFDVVVRTENGGEVTTATCASQTDARAEVARVMDSLNAGAWLETDAWSIRCDVVVAVGSRPRAATL